MKKMKTTGTEDFSVLGADGFVGAALCTYLEKSGFSYQAFGRGQGKYFSKPLGHAIYCIGLTADYLDRPMDTVTAHVSLFAELLEKADFESLTYLSSTRLYDGAELTGCENDDLVLNPHNPRHLYDFSKGLGESLCLTGGRDNVRAARLSCVYAPDLKADNFLHAILKAACEKKCMSLKTHGEAARDYVHIDDVCSALVHIALRGKRQIYNVASGENVTNAALVSIIERLTGCAIRFSTPDGPAMVAPRVDIESLRGDFSMEPTRLADALPLILSDHLPFQEKRMAVR